MIRQLKKAASDSGINLIVTNSREKIDTQINKMMRVEDGPNMLVSWDLDYTMSFNSDGMLNNPSVKFVVLLMSKAIDQGDEAKLDKAEEMGSLFKIFGQNLFTELVKVSKSTNAPITEFGYKLAPLYGTGHHSGVIGRITCIDEIINICD